MQLKRSPLAPATCPTLPAIEGVQLAASHCGIKYKDRADLLLAVMDEGTTVAGTLTTSQTASANIEWAKQALPHGEGRILIVNSGNANAFNGKNGEESVTRIVEASASLFQCSPHSIYPCATGVIGQPLPDNLITDALATLQHQLTSTSWKEAANAITTTDTFPKMATRTATIGDTHITINGIAKGSGMIAPDMATMLAYIFTDATLPAPVLQALLSEGVEQSFNAITVDSDTSTSDTALLFATNKKAHIPIHSAQDEQLQHFKQQLFDLLQDLAHQIVKDGEGASKFITIHVTGAESHKAAKKIGLAIGNSPLVKTAIAGEDANWGRIVMAVGKSGEKANRDTLTIQIGEEILATKGQLNPDYDEAVTTAYMKNDHIDIHVDIGIGEGTATVWTCDLTERYIHINADYRS